MPLIYLLVIIFFLSLNMRPSITSVGPLLDIIIKDLAISGVTASLITTLPVLCMGVFALLAIKLSNRLGIEKSLIIAMLLIFIATLMRAFTSSSSTLILTALFSGIGIGIAGPLISGFIKKYFPHRLSVTSIYSVSMVIGASLATTFSIPLYKKFNDSWQMSLSFWSILALLAVLLLIPLIIQKQPQRPVMAMPKLKFNNKRIYLFMIFFGCMASVFYAITAWLAPIAQNMGMTYAQSGYVLTLFTITQIPVSLAMPFLVEKIATRKFWLLFSGMAELVGVVILLFGFSPWLAAISLGIGAGGLFPLALLLPIQESTDANEATSWSAMMQAGGFTFASMGPILFGLTVDLSGSFKPALLVLVFILCLLFIMVRKIEAKPLPTN